MVETLDAFSQGYSLGAADSTIIMYLLGIILLIVVLWACSSSGRRKSQQYRKFLADMYVAAKIRWFAKQDNLDIDAETESFKLWQRKNKVREHKYDVDVAVEENLEERIEADVDKLQNTGSGYVDLTSGSAPGPKSSKK